MTGGDAYKQKLHAHDALDAAIYADPSQPAIRKGSGCPRTPVINGSWLSKMRHRPSGGMR